MEQSFLLKYYGGFDIFEMQFMTAEERAWYIDRINKEIKRQNESSKGGPKGGPGMNLT